VSSAFFQRVAALGKRLRPTPIVALEHPELELLGIVGAGVIARNVYEFLLETGWDLEGIVLFDVDRAEGAA
jgi:hypothetical protein